MKEKELLNFIRKIVIANELTEDLRNEGLNLLLNSINVSTLINTFSFDGENYNLSEIKDCLESSKKEDGKINKILLIKNLRSQFKISLKIAKDLAEAYVQHVSMSFG